MWAKHICFNQIRNQGGCFIFAATWGELCEMAFALLQQSVFSLMELWH
jgi:hypothetical protein